MTQPRKHNAFAQQREAAYDYASVFAPDGIGAARDALRPLTLIRTPRRSRISIPDALAAQRVAMLLLRLSLAAVFFWFGVLKLGAASPAATLIKSSFPFLAESPYMELLGLAEMLLAVGLVIERLTKPAIILMTLHLLCTLGVALISPQVIFTSGFPMLTLEGEFVMKNLVLIAAGGAIATSRRR